MTFHISKDGVFTAEAVDLNSGRHHLWQVSILDRYSRLVQLALALCQLQHSSRYCHKGKLSADSWSHTGV